jgi:hypothetical protein
LKSLTAALLLAVAMLTTGCFPGDPKSNCDRGDAPRCRGNTPSHCESSEGNSPAGLDQWEGIPCGAWLCDDSGAEPICVPPPPAPMTAEVTAEGCTHLTVVDAPFDADESVALDIPTTRYASRALADLTVDAQGRTELSSTEALVVDAGLVDAGGDPAAWLKADAPTYDDQSLREEPTGEFIVRLNERVSFRGDLVEAVGVLHLAEVLICLEGEAVRPVFTFHPDGQLGPVSGLKVKTQVDGAGVAQAGPVDLIIR